MAQWEFVAASNDDVNALFLINKFKSTMDELSKKKSNGKALTVENYMHVTQVLLEQHVGMFNYFDKQLKENKEELKQVKADKAKQDLVITDMAGKMETYKKELVSTKLELEKTQQHANRDSFKLCNIKEPQLPQGHFEDTQDTIIKALATANVQIKKEEISSSFRVPSKPDNSRPGPTPSKNIIIKCALQDVKDRIMRNKKMLRENEAFQKDFPAAFIVEQLTPLRSKVAYLLRNDPNIEKVWSINGRIKYVVKGAGNDRPKTIDSLAQLKLVPGWNEEKVENLVLNQ